MPAHYLTFTRKLVPERKFGTGDRLSTMYSNEILQWNVSLRGLQVQETDYLPMYSNETRP